MSVLLMDKVRCNLTTQVGFISMILTHSFLQGITALMALGILESLQQQSIIPPLDTLPHNSTAYLHAIIESLRLAFADTNYYVADPEIVHLPVKEMLSKVEICGSSLLKICHKIIFS